MEWYWLDAIIIVLIFGVLVILYLQWNRTYGYWRRIGVPGPFPWPFIGSAHQYFIKSTEDLFNGNISKYGKVAGLYFFSQKILLVADPEMVHEILVKKPTNFLDRQNPPLKDEFGKKLLVSLNKDEWKPMRKIWAPAFSERNLKGLTEQTNMCADTLVKLLLAAGRDGQSFDISSFTSVFAFNTTAANGFGVEIKSNENPDNPIFHQAQKIFQDNPLFFLSFFMPAVFNFIQKVTRPIWRINMFQQKYIDVFTKLMIPVIAKRKSKEEIKTDFLQNIVERMTSKPKIMSDFNMKEKERKEYTDDDIVAQSLMFLFGGHETTRMSLAYLAYHLALNPQCQDRLCRDIDEAMQGKIDVDHDVLKDLPYLDMVIDESMRTRIPFLSTVRVCNEDVEIKGIPIQKGTMIILAMQYMAEDPDAWPEPQKFRPERFTREEIAKRHPGQYVPFSLGQRNCVGMRFAKLNLRIAIVKMLRHFKFRTCSETEVPLKVATDNTRSPLNGIRLTLELRI